MSVNEVKLLKAVEPFVVKGSGKATNRTFCLGDEDHTLGNALRHVLIQNSKVGFAGYSVPHPSEPVVHIRVQTVETPTSGSSNTNASNDDQTHQSYNAIDALREACQTLYSQCDIVMEQVEEILPEVRDDRIRMENLLLEEDDDEIGNDEDDKEL